MRTTASSATAAPWCLTAALCLALVGCDRTAATARDAAAARADAGPTRAEPNASAPDGGGPGVADGGPADLDAQLRGRLRDAGVATPAVLPAASPQLVALGRALMFDKVLSGRRDIACATCHLPAHGTGDGLTLSFGTGGHGAGPERTLGERGLLVPRNAIDLFNRGLLQDAPLMWDARVGGALEAQSAEVPARPPGLSGNLAMQALLPLLSREEMRGLPDELDVTGAPNELGALPDDAPERVWQAVMARLLALPEYVALLRAAYPEVQDDRFEIHHVANALAAFVASELLFVQSPLDAFLAGDDAALSEDAKRGGMLFTGRGNCAGCHAGPLLSNLRLARVGAPQLGPGRGRAAPLDVGAAEHTGRAEDRFAFRVPPLRNVELTAPYMHDGAYATLEAVVRHYDDIPRALQTYDASQLHPLLQDAVHRDPALLEELVQGLDPLVRARRELSAAEVAQLVAFLRALTDPAARDLAHLVPERVPSGLPVAD